MSHPIASHRRNTRWGKYSRFAARVVHQAKRVNLNACKEYGAGMTTLHSPAFLSDLATTIMEDACGEKIKPKDCNEVSVNRRVYCSTPL